MEIFIIYFKPKLLNAWANFKIKFVVYIIISIVFLLLYIFFFYNIPEASCMGGQLDICKIKFPRTFKLNALAASCDWTNGKYCLVHLDVCHVFTSAKHYNNVEIYKYCNLLGEVKAQYMAGSGIRGIPLDFLYLQDISQLPGFSDPQFFEAVQKTNKLIITKQVPFIRPPVDFFIRPN